MERAGEKVDETLRTLKNDGLPTFQETCASVNPRAFHYARRNNRAGLDNHLQLLRRWLFSLIAQLSVDL
jgi:hypothetical protein